MKKKAFTLIEMVVVVMIIGILTSILTPVLSNAVYKARVARTKADIKSLEVAIERYMIDTGNYPLSGSYNFRTEAPDSEYDATKSSINTTHATGCGLLYLALAHGIREYPSDAAPATWDGPYINFESERIDFNGFPDGVDGAPITASESSSANGRGADEVKPDLDYNNQILDTFGEPFRYIRATNYVDYGGTELNSSDPYLASETYYRNGSYQIVSCGKNRIAKDINDTNCQTIGVYDADDIKNF